MASEVGEGNRCPPAVNGLQVNTCRNLRCGNYGIAPLDRVSRGKNPKIVDQYISVGAGKGIAGLRCKQCQETFVTKSNLAIVEELHRLREQSKPNYSVGCITADCANLGKPETSPPSLYQSFGNSAAGSLRFRCKECRKTFTVPVRASLRQRLPGKTALLFSLLINKSPMRRICEVAEVNPAVLYQRIGFIHEQCVRVAAEMEAGLSALSPQRLGIAVDRQEHVLNWSSQFDRRVTQLGAVASADTASGYVFGIHLDYDPRFDVHDLELAAQECGDPARSPAFRRYARIFLPFETAQVSAIEPLLAEGTRLPARGVRVHVPYTLIAHFLFLKERLPNVGSLHFYMDREPGIRGGCFAAFGSDLQAGRAEAFLVKIDKSLTVDEKKLALAASHAALAKLALKHPTLRRLDVAKRMIVEAITQPAYQALPPLHRWVTHPMPNMGEPAKAACYLSDRGDLSPEVLADYLLSVRMHALDRFFMQVRRRLSVLERPIASPSGSRRWHGYAVYNPSVVANLLEIFRVVYNFAFAGEDGRTPAMRLGLAATPMTLTQIIEFVPARQSSTKA